jgi:nicotinamide-nucleotide amidase
VSPGRDIGLEALAQRVVAAAVASGTTLATAESLTAGMVCSALGGVPGVSAVLRGGVVAYTPAAKSGLLGVEADLLAERGAVNEPVARQMAAGARHALGADLAVATTGVAGPGPADGVPAGTVFVAVQGRFGEADVRELALAGTRHQVREAAAATALQMLLDHLAPPDAPDATA